MILDVSLKKNDKGVILSPASAYRPSKKVKARTAEVMKDFQTGQSIMTKPYRQFNDKSVLQRQSIDQQIFNAYVEPQNTNDEESWKSQAIRPIVRNRTISIAAHVTGSLMYPQTYAQNEQDKSDQDAADVMRDLMEWAGEQSNYPKTFLYAVIAALVNPAVIVHTEYADVKRTIKEINEKGGWSTKEIQDEIFSGFQDSIVPIDELFIGDIYEPEIQKQPFLVWRRAIDYSIARTKYAGNKNFEKYVRAGIQVIFDSGTDQFYEQHDENLQERLVEEVIYYNRSADLRLVFVNGVLLTDPDQPNPRKDKRYPFAKTGYELFDEGKFFYYSSLVKKMSKDEEVLNTLYRMVIDGGFLRLMPPVAIFGKEEVNSSVITPGAMTTFDEKSRLEKIDVTGSTSEGLALIEKVEGSLSESSQDVLQSGQDAGGSNTAFEISRLEQNAKIMLGMFAKMIGFLVQDLGELRMSDIVQFLTVADVNQLTGEGTRLRFQSFLMPDKTVEGTKKTRKIEFTNDFIDAAKDPLDLSFDVLNEEGGMDSDMEIYKVAPKAFRELKFRVKVSPETVTPPSDNVKRALNLEAYDRAIGSPFANQEALYTDLLLGSYDTTKGNTDKYVMKQDEQMQQQMMMQGQTGKPSNPLSSVLGAGPNQSLNKVVA